MNLADELIIRSKRKYGADHTISLYNGMNYTIGDYISMVSEFKNRCADNKLPVRGVAVLVFNDNPTAISAFLGCISYGLVPVLISPNTSDRIIENIINTIKPLFFVTEEKHVRPMFSHFPAILMSEKDKKLVLPHKFQLQSNYKLLEEDNIAYLGLTSGSSGMPKIVMHCHDEMIFACENFADKTLELKPQDILFSVAKMHFTYGMANSLFFSFYTGAASILSEEPFLEEHTLKLMANMKPTCFFAVPAVYKRLLQYLSETKNDYTESFADLRMCMSSGELLKVEIAQRWHELTDVFIWDSVGCSETGSAFLFNRHTDIKPGCAGKPVPGYQLHLLESTDSFKGSDCGILCIKSKSNAAGYYCNTEETERKFRNGWIMTGDIFSIDRDGDFWYVGRIDNLIKKNGLWVDLSKIERTVMQFPGVMECAVMKVERKINSHIGACICTDNSFQGFSSLKKFLSEHLESYEQPTLFRAVPAMPLNQNDKIDYQSLKQRFDRVLITIDGPNKVGKSTVSGMLAKQYDMQLCNAGIVFRFISWAAHRYYISEPYEKETLTQLLDKAYFNGEQVVFNDENISDELHGHEVAMRAAEIATVYSVQDAVIGFIKRFVKGKSAIVEGRNMGSDIFPDADLKIYLYCTPEKRISQWCKLNGYGKDMYEYALSDMTKRNGMDRNRKYNPLKKPEDAIEICIDDKTMEEVVSEITIYINSIV